MNAEPADGGRRRAEGRTWFTRNPRWTIVLMSGLWALAYPPFGVWTFALAGLGLAFLATASLPTPGAAFRAWFLGGLLYNTVMYWWIYNVMKVGPALLIGFGLILMIAFLSLFNGLLGWSFRRALASRRPKLLLALYPLAWAGLEAARAVGDLSFPWNNLGYVTGGIPALFQSVSLWGTYGLSAALVATNVLFFLFCAHRRWKALAGFALLPLLLWAHGALALGGADAATAQAPRLDIALVQPSIPQTKKWDEEYFAEVMGKTFRTIEGAEGNLAPVRGADLIVLAETAVPDFLRNRAEIRDSLRAISRLAGAPLVTGALDYVRDRTPWSEYKFYNSAFLFAPGDTAPPLQYSKLRLVPFSEKLPFDGIFPIINYVNLGEGDFSPGDGHRLWDTRGETWSPSICYEVIYPSFARAAREGGARLLVNVTNDGWFGRSNGPYQHANIARFRAAETGIPVARAANNGVSVFYDAWGRDLGRTRLMDSTVLRREVPLAVRETPYTRLGDGIDAFFMFAGAAWLGLLFASGRREPVTLST
jgi:apolipoprotein N-acyltransferase